jgi:uncharacterized protein (UPF0332 family)
VSFEQRKDLVRYWWSKAEDSLASAKRELHAGSYSFSVNRLYYAAFYAASAALLDRQLSFKKHAGVRAAFHQQLIKGGLLAQEWGELYDQLFEDRQEGDYAPMVSFKRAYVESLMGRCSKLLDALRPLISSLSEG